MSKTLSAQPYSQPWVDKHRPKTLNDVVGNKEVLDRLRAFAANKTFPNACFHGPAGNGKTTTALCLVNDVFEGKGAVRVLNASKDRGIKIIQGEVLEFAAHRSLSGRFKVFIMDEADHLTADAQAALREVIGQHQSNCRFILVCNDVSRLIQPILSRCPPFEFRPLSDNEVMAIMMKVARAEGKQVSIQALRDIASAVRGDARMAVNRLETACTGVQRVDKVDFMSTRGMYFIEQILIAAQRGDFMNAMNQLAETSKFVNARSFLDRCIQAVYESQDMNLDKVELAAELANCDYTRGGEEVQAMGLIARMVRNAQRKFPR